MPSKRKLTVSKPVTIAKPVLGATATAQANAGRSNVAKPASVPAVAGATSPAAKPARIAGVSRTCATIAKNATNFGHFNAHRDQPYLSFYARFAKRSSNGIVTVADIAEAFRATGARPDYDGSCKPHDAGVINRLRKAGFVVPVSDGTSFTFAPTVTASKAPDKASADLLQARALYSAAKPI